MKDNNLLGRNIQRLREIHGDTLEELGVAVGFAKSTIKGYENGSREAHHVTARSYREIKKYLIERVEKIKLIGLGPYLGFK